MDCPVCKYPNPAGATHCQMCYEVFNRSAAQTYMQQVREERRQQNRLEAEEKPAFDVGSHLRKTLDQIDWFLIKRLFRQTFEAYRIPILAVSAGVVIVSAALLIHPSLIWFDLFGSRLAVKVPSKKAVPYLIEFHSELKSWSERQGQFDTPLEEFQVDELGNVLVTRQKEGRKVSLSVEPREWIQIIHRSNKTESRAIPLSHPSLGLASVLLNRRGLISERRYPLTPRMAKAMTFLFPQFPKGRWREDKSWTEKVQWLDTLNDWKILWKGEIRWRMGDTLPCGNDTCVQLFSEAVVQPSVWAAPAWAAKSIGKPTWQGSFRGDLLFNTTRHQLYAHGLKGDGTLRFSIPNVGIIPAELRVGRPVRGLPGTLQLQLHTKVDVHRS